MIIVVSWRVCDIDWSLVPDSPVVEMWSSCVQEFAIVFMIDKDINRRMYAFINESPFLWILTNKPCTVIISMCTYMYGDLISNE